MSLFEDAVKTYDIMSNCIGEYKEDKDPLAPVGYISISKKAPKIEITINTSSEFIKATKTDLMVLIPSTQESMGRSSAPSPHPLSDNLGYLSEIDCDKKEMYLEQLYDWTCFEKDNKFLLAIYNYVKSNKILSDLNTCGILAYDEENKVKNEKDLVIWTVLDTENDEIIQTWKSKKIMDSYQKYYINKISDCKKNICMIYGKKSVLASQHLKGVFSLNGNAKLISANDTANFTYRGRFIDSDETCTISYEASQKAHNALKWLLQNQGEIIGGRCFVCWNPEGTKLPGVTRPSNIGRVDEQTANISNYKEEFAKTLNGYRANLTKNSSAIIVAFDAATTGRLSLAYYNKLKASDFLDRLEKWDTTCCWLGDKEKVYSPLLNEIIDYAFGTPIENKGSKTLKADDKIVAPVMQQLVNSRINQVKFPKVIMRNIFHKSNNLQIYENSNKNSLRDYLLRTACAVIKKYRYDHLKEEWKMALEPERKDRSYQFGRMLAILEKIERDTYDKKENREPNAIRMQGVFVNRPAYVTKILIDKLKVSYYPRLSSSAKIRYDKLIGEIMEVISGFSDKEFNKPLTETYLLGYYLQRNSLYAKKERNTEINENDMEK